MSEKDRQKKVAIIGTRGYPSYYGGFETAVRHVAPALRVSGWDVTVYGRPGATREEDPGRDPSIHSVMTRGIESKSLSTLSYGLTSCIHAFFTKPDAVLVMNVANGFWLPLLRLRGIPTLVNVDGIEWDRAKWGRFAKTVFKAGARLTAKHANRLVFDAREIAKRWNDDFGREGEFIPYGGTPSPTLPLEDGLEHRGYVLVVARFVPENSIPEFLDAAVELSRSWDVVIVGSSGYGGPLESQARSLTEASRAIHWLGHVSDDLRLHSLWQHAGAYFHGHSVGGTNPALVQAMALGVPIVARDTVYNREVIGDDGVYVQARAADISRGVSEVMKNPSLQERLSASALRRSAEEYSWELVCDRYQNALLALIAPVKTESFVHQVP